jgi:hypothetical protein
MTRLLFIVVVAVVGAQASRAQVAPLAASTPSLELGVDQFAGPVVRGGFSPDGQALVVGRVDVGARVVGVAFGGQWQQRLWGPLSVREAITAGPIVSALGPAAGGLSADALLQLGVDIGDVVVLVGPRLGSALLLVGEVPGRGIIDGVVAVKIPVADSLAITASASAGGERSYRGFAPGGAALTGSLAVGLQWRP